MKEVEICTVVESILQVVWISVLNIFIFVATLTCSQKMSAPSCTVAVVSVSPTSGFPAKLVSNSLFSIVWGKVFL